MNVLSFQKFKQEKKKISMVTCYDYWTAKILNTSNIDCILVGDSLAMVMHGYPSTLQATIDMMALHTSAVARGAKDKFIITDMPFMSFRKDITSTMNAVEKLMQAGAHAVKLEGIRGHEQNVKHIVESGVPVMGHLGLIPQSIHKFGGFKVQGKEQQAAGDILEDSQSLQDLGVFSMVLECVPNDLARRITQKLTVPTIGIGAGPDVDGQVLVLQDLLGANTDFKPKFLRQYSNAAKEIHDAVNEFNSDVKDISFPKEEESYL